MQLTVMVMVAMLMGLGCATAGCGTCAGTPKCPKGAVLIPAGTFMMGDDDFRESDGSRAGKPAHQVTLTKPYCMDRTEVTAQAFYDCLKANKCTYPEARVLNRRVFANHAPKEPAQYVNWADAQAYCKAHGGRLPTEAEWEFAARGTDGRIYPWGNEEPTHEHWQAWVKDGPEGASDVGKHPKGRSFFGLEDMAGNVWEWTADRWGPVIPEPAVDPQGPPAQKGVEEERVIKGSTWWAHPKHARASLRVRALIESRDDQTGMRCAYDPD